MPAATTSVYLGWRYTFLSFSKLVLLAFWSSPGTHAAPLGIVPWFSAQEDEDGSNPSSDSSLWLYLGTAAVLVLLGGAFAGLTIALMGQDEVYLQVIRESGEGAEKKHADRVLHLLQRGKHWVLVTLLLSNVITNETLPIVLDRSLGGGWPAVLGSTVLIVIFGEIVPQSVCVRYGLPIGSWMAPFVLVLMYVLAPVAWPTAKLLDYLLGKDHGTIYKKAGLKTLVSLHKSMGEVGQQLNTDEVTIISAVLDLKDKSVGSIMTPMDDVFTLSLDDVLDENTMDDILSRGYSRIPIHHPDKDENFVGMLLVKMLITYDPEDAKPVRDFALATLPETRPDTSCLDIINFFQEGKSHMILVSEYPGEDYGAIGVVTLEDVIEELIGEEIVDESDVFIDVHKAIRRAIPAPRMRIPRGHVVEDPPSATVQGDLAGIDEHVTLSLAAIQRSKTVDDTSQKPKSPAVAQRRSSATSQAGDRRLPVRGASADLKEHLKHIGPSNLASRPKTTRFNTVKIKPGTEGQKAAAQSDGRTPSARRVSENAADHQRAIGEGVLSSGGKHASDGVQAVKAGYGALSGSPSELRSSSVDKGIQAHLAGSEVPSLQKDDGDQSNKPEQPSVQATGAESTVGSLPERRTRSRSPYYKSQGPARSGSITENIVDTNGIRKVVLGTTSSGESNDDRDNSGANKNASHPGFLGDVMDVIFVPSDLIRDFLMDLSNTYARIAKPTFPVSQLDAQMQRADRHVRQLFLLMMLCMYVFDLLPLMLAKGRQVWEAVVAGLGRVCRGAGSRFVTSGESTHLTDTVEHWKGRLEKALVKLTEESEQHQAALRTVEEDSRMISCLKSHVDQLTRDMVSAGAPPDAYPYLQTPCFRLLPLSVTPDCLPMPCLNHEAAKAARHDLAVTQQELAAAVSELTAVKQVHVNEIDGLKKAYADKVDDLNKQPMHAAAAAAAHKASIERDAWDAHFQDRLARALEEDGSRRVALLAENKRLSADVAAARAEVDRVTAVKDDYLGKIAKWREHSLKQKENAWKALAARDKRVADLQAALSESTLVRRVKELEGQLVAAKAAAASAGELEERQVREKEELRSKLLTQEKTMATMADNITAMEKKLAGADMLITAKAGAVENFKGMKTRAETALAEEKKARQAAESKLGEVAHRNEVQEKLAGSSQAQAEGAVEEMRRAYQALEKKSVELDSALAKEKDANVTAEARVVELTKQNRTLQGVIMTAQAEARRELEQQQQQHSMAGGSGAMDVDAPDGHTAVSDVQAQIEDALREERAKWEVEAKKMVDEAVASERELAAGFENAVAEIVEERMEELEASLGEARRERDSSNGQLEENFASREKLGVTSKRPQEG
ncbi:hypothetical protein DV737_g5432, partial [Chaetothyriales sp. CBS 132003]